MNQPLKPAATAQSFQHTAARRRLAHSYRHLRKHLPCFNTQPPEGGWWLGRLSNTATSKFQHTAARRRLGFPASQLYRDAIVSTHSRPKAAGRRWRSIIPCKSVSTHSRPKAAGSLPVYECQLVEVSTHSRPKAAGGLFADACGRLGCFNTQPPEGGWDLRRVMRFYFGKPAAFQHTAARRRLECTAQTQRERLSFQHTAARRRLGRKAAPKPSAKQFQHTAARRRLVTAIGSTICAPKFQHTAARRRLVKFLYKLFQRADVSTHSRPKAAGNPVDFAKQKITVSTHSRPKAAGVSLSSQSGLSMFQHTAARRRLVFHATALPAR